MGKFWYDRYEPAHDGLPATLTREYNDGSSSEVMSGDEALANAENADGDKFRAEHPGLAIRAKAYAPGDYRNGTMYGLGKGFRRIIDSPEKTWVGKAIGDNPFQAAAVMGGTGLVGGMLANFLLKRLGLADNPKMHLIGGLGGLLAGAYTGYQSGQLNKTAGITKSAAMYRDPRNFILEKLQAANDLTSTEKAQLAASVRAMSPRSADILAKSVRAAMGFGVGAIIAKFLGLNTRGTVLGGLTSLFGARALNVLSSGFGRMF